VFILFQILGEMVCLCVGSVKYFRSHAWNENALEASIWRIHVQVT